MNISNKNGLLALLVCISMTMNLKSVWVTEILNASSGPIGVKINDIDQWKRDVIYVNPEGDLVKTSGSTDVWLKSGASAKIENTPMPWVGKTNKGEEKKIVICAVKDDSFIDTCSGPGLISRTELNDYYSQIVRKIFVSEEKEVVDAKGAKTKKWVNVVYEPQTVIHNNSFQDEVIAIVVRDGKTVNDPVRVDIVAPSSIDAYRETYKLQKGLVTKPVAPTTPKPLPIEEPKKVVAPAPLVTKAPSKPQTTTPTSGQIELNLSEL